MFNQDFAADDTTNASTFTILADHFNNPDTYSIKRPKGRMDWLLFYTLDGEGYIRTPSGEKRCGAGDIGLLRAGIPHEYGTAKGAHWNFVWVHFPGLVELSYLPQEEALLANLPDGPVRERVYCCFQNLLHDSRTRDSLWHRLCENSLREIILLAAQRLKKNIDPRIEQALHILTQSMKEPLRLEELAGRVGLSVSRLAHLFKHETGETVVEHLNRMRIRQAELMIVQMGRSPTEASLDVGFDNYNHFAELFRKYCGLSPRAYKKAQNQSSETR